MAEKNDNTVTIDGKRYDADTIREAMDDATIGRAPVGIMGDNDLRDGITNRLRWSLAVVTLIAQDANADDCITDAAHATVLHLEQARDMLRELTDAAQVEDEEAEPDDEDRPGPARAIYDDIIAQESCLQTLLDDFPNPVLTDADAEIDDASTSELTKARDLLAEANCLIEQARKREGGRHE